MPAWILLILITGDPHPIVRHLPSLDACKAEIKMLTPRPTYSYLGCYELRYER